MIFSKKYSIFGLALYFLTNISSGNQEVKVSESEGLALYKESKNLYLEYEKAHGGWVQTKNVRMHYLQWGEENAIPLIWANGTYSSAYELSGVSDDLVEAGLRVIAIDYYGHGPTEIPEHEVSIYHVADDIKALMNSLGIDKAYIGGWSRGGGVATAFYDEYPEKVIGLILGDGGFFHPQSLFEDQTDAEILNTYNNARFPNFAPEKTEHMLFYNHIKIWEAGSPSDYLPIFPNIRQDKDGKWIFNWTRVRQWLGDDSGERFLKFIRLPSKAPLFQESSFAINPKIVYRNLDVPILIFDPVSEDEPFSVTEYARNLKKQHGNLVTHKIYENTGHGFFLEHPERFVRDVVEFVKKER